MVSVNPVADMRIESLMVGATSGLYGVGREGGDAMLCTRCGGLLIKNWWDFPYGMAQGELQGTRCVNCGSIDDPVIRARINDLRIAPA